MRRLLAALMLAGVAASADAQKRDTIHVKVGDTARVGWSLGGDTSHFHPIPGTGSFIAVSCGATVRIARDYAGAAVVQAKARRVDSVVYVADCPAPPVVPPVVVDTSKKALVLAFVGPTIPASALPASLRWYDDTAKAELNTQWAAYGPQWDASNSISGYERAAIYYVWWARTGDTTYLSRAHQTAVNYRDNYLIPAGYGTSPHWSQMESLYLDWIVTGDTKSRDAVMAVAGKFTAFLSRDAGTQSYITNTGGADQDSRIQARMMISQWAAEKIAGTPNRWLDSAIVQTLSTMNAQGFTAWKNTCGGSLNYMGGMNFDILPRIHDQRPGPYNAAIEAKAMAFANYLWSTQWRGATGDPSFNYLSLLCNGTGSPTSAPDLNGLILPLFGWLGKTTGDTTWFVKGDQIMGGMRNAFVSGYRQLSESYSSSFRYLGYRYGR